jgi:hypothetical protein
MGQFIRVVDNKARRMVRRVSIHKYNKAKAEHDAWIEEQKDQILKVVIDDWANNENGDRS